MTDIDLHEVEKQLILYTKNHFGRINYDEDLKYFASRLYGFSFEEVDKRNINNMVVSLYEKLAAHGYIQYTLGDFLSNTFKQSYRKDGRDNVTWSDIHDVMLGQIQGMRVLGLDNGDLELGEADCSIIPEGRKRKVADSFNKVVARNGEALRRLGEE